MTVRSVSFLLKISQKWCKSLGGLSFFLLQDLLDIIRREKGSLQIQDFTSSTSLFEQQLHYFNAYSRESRIKLTKSMLKERTNPPLQQIPPYCLKSCFLQIPPFNQTNPPQKKPLGLFFAGTSSPSPTRPPVTTRSTTGGHLFP